MDSVKSARITVLLENAPKYDTYLKGCFGLSLWIEVKTGGGEKRILFDVGPLAEPLTHNARMLGIDIAEADLIVLSHCHFDHTAALADVVSEIDGDVSVLAHPEVFRQAFTLEPGYMNYGMSGRNSRENLQRLGVNFTLSKSPLEVFPGVMYSGEVKRTEAFEKRGGVSSFTVDASGAVIADPILDDVSLAINLGDRGMVVLTGCAHAGPINIIRHLKDIAGVDRIEGIMGGFHLLEADAARVNETVRIFQEIDPAWIAPMHCTGLIPSARIADAFPGRFEELHGGDVLEFK
ncbi:MAG: MBL fold metallo-hydrolase [Clostridia bacterium]